LPATTLGFGICSVATAFTHDIHQVSGVRFLLGMFEAGLMPGIAYYLSRWYRRSEVRPFHIVILQPRKIY
jgi:MFS family permease